MCCVVQVCDSYDFVLRLVLKKKTEQKDENIKVNSKKLLLNA